MSRHRPSPEACPLYVTTPTVATAASPGCCGSPPKPGRVHAHLTGDHFGRRTGFPPLSAPASPTLPRRSLRRSSCGCWRTGTSRGGHASPSGRIRRRRCLLSVHPDSAIDDALHPAPGSADEESQKALVHLRAHRLGGPRRERRPRGRAMPLQLVQRASCSAGAVPVRTASLADLPESSPATTPSQWRSHSRRHPPCANISSRRFPSRRSPVPASLGGTAPSSSHWRLPETSGLRLVRPSSDQGSAAGSDRPRRTGLPVSALGLSSPPDYGVNTLTSWSTTRPSQHRHRRDCDGTAPPDHSPLRV